VRAASRRAGTVREGDAPRTALERELAAMWAELLNVNTVGIHDNFFALGGHSLLAVQLLSRVRQTYGADLSLEVVYGGEFTVAELAKAVELKEIEQTGGGYQELLAELEGLSDEEVRALLAEEQDAS
jgi:acyl carrier protein